MVGFSRSMRLAITIAVAVVLVLASAPSAYAVKAYPKPVTYYQPDGTPFEARALPPDSLGKPYLRMRLTGELPEGWRIEVAEVGPAFGRDGGGLQIRVLDANHQAMRMYQLEEQGIVKTIKDSPPPAEMLTPFAGTLANAPDWDDEGN